MRKTLKSHILSTYNKSLFLIGMAKPYTIKLRNTSTHKPGDRLITDNGDIMMVLSHTNPSIGNHIYTVRLIPQYNLLQLLKKWYVVED